MVDKMVCSLHQILLIYSAMVNCNGVVFHAGAQHSALVHSSREPIMSAVGYEVKKEHYLLTINYLLYMH